MFTQESIKEFTQEFTQESIKEFTQESTEEFGTHTQESTQEFTQEPKGKRFHTKRETLNPREGRGWGETTDLKING